MGLPAQGQVQPNATATPSVPQSQMAPSLLQPWDPFPTANTLGQPALLRPAAGGTGAGGAGSPPALLAQLGIDVTETGTDNAYLTPTGTRADVITRVSPTVSLTGESRRFDLGLNYDGTYDRYIYNPNLNGFTHNGIASLTTQVIEDQFFVDTRGTVSQQSVNPTGPSTGGTRNSPEAQTRIFSGAITPRLQETLGSWGLLEATATYDRTINEAIGAVSGPGAAPSAPGPSLGNTTIGQSSFDLRSGPAFSRLSWDYLASASQTEQSLGNLSQSSNQLSAEYHFTHYIAGMVSLGYDTISGLDVSSAAYGGLFYSAGAHWTPNPDTDVAAGAGWRYGGPEIYAQVNQQIGARSTFRLSQNVGVGTDASSVLASLESAQRDAQGNFVDPFSGLAANPGAANTTFNNGVNRQRTTNLVFEHNFDTDVVTLTATFTQQKTISGPQTLVTPVTGVPLASTSSVLSGGASWTHELTRSTSSSASINGADTVSANLPSSLTKTLSAQLGLAYQVTETLTANVGYEFSWSYAPTGSLSLTQTQSGSITDNTVFVDVTKHF